MCEKQLRLLIYSEQDAYENIAIILVCVSTQFCAGTKKR